MNRASTKYRTGLNIRFLPLLILCAIMFMVTFVSPATASLFENRTGLFLSSDTGFAGVEGGLNAGLHRVYKTFSYDFAPGSLVVSKSGTSAFRQGTFADEAADWGGNYVKGKQWAADNPLTTKGYAKKYGLPAENTGKPDWVVKGRVENYKTRPAPASHNNPANTGGGTEIIPDNPNNVKLDWFHMPD